MKCVTSNNTAYLRLVYFLNKQKLIKKQIDKDAGKVNSTFVS